jgi:hypothetical protein
MCGCGIEAGMRWTGRSFAMPRLLRWDLWFRVVGRMVCDADAWVQADLDGLTSYGGRNVGVRRCLRKSALLCQRVAWSGKRWHGCIDGVSDEKWDLAKALSNLSCLAFAHLPVVRMVRAYSKLKCMSGEPTHRAPHKRSHAMSSLQFYDIRSAISHCMRHLFRRHGISGKSTLLRGL